ncbi:MAG TPA: Fur family transcriptional regulator [Oceanospirillaceae bacterium]|nr:Fur family transcriptional regulator [Oceanospirillaceae bacterium]
MQSTPFQQHDHSHCIATAMQQAQGLCQERGVRLTPVRQRVLELVWQSHQPLGAYDLLARLGEDGFNSAPPTVYRALDFLQEQGLIHKLTSVNAYTGCCSPGTPHEGHFFLCLSCNQALELDTSTLQESLQSSANTHGFTIAQQTIEVTGFCARCLANDKQPGHTQHD